MELLVTFTVLVIVTGVFLCGALQGLVRVWLDYRLRLKLLERIAARTDAHHSIDEIRALLEGPSTAARVANRHNHALTGVFVTVAGLTCIVAGSVIRVGQVAVGLHAGGWLCLAPGAILILLGLLRNLSRTTSSGPGATKEAP